MVKTKKINNFTLYLLAFLCLFFVGCDLSSFIPSLDGGEITPTYSIETPSYLKIITTDDSTLTYYTRYDNLALIVNDNPDANGYAFYVYGGNGDYNNLSLYTRFVTEKNYYELKNVFGEEEGKIPYTQKRYYFYAIALGGEIDGITYKDSANSPIKFIDFKKELETPIANILSSSVKYMLDSIPALIPIPSPDISFFHKSAVISPVIGSRETAASALL